MTSLSVGHMTLTLPCRKIRGAFLFRLEIGTDVIDTSAIMELAVAIVCLSSSKIGVMTEYLYSICFHLFFYSSVVKQAMLRKKIFQHFACVSALQMILLQTSFLIKWTNTLDVSPLWLLQVSSGVDIRDVHCSLFCNVSGKQSSIDKINQSAQRHFIQIQTQKFYHRTDPPTVSCRSDVNVTACWHDGITEFMYHFLTFRLPLLSPWTHSEEV